MDKKNLKIKILDRVNEHFKKQFELGYTSYEFKACDEYFKEHKYSYSVGWSLKNEDFIPFEKRTFFSDTGPILVSKISNHIQIAGLSESIDYITKFELKIRGLEPIWILKIEYQKQHTIILKSILNLNTPEIISRINNNCIEIENSKNKLENIKATLNTYQIKSTLIYKERKISDN